MTELRLHNPDTGIYAATPDYAHALEVIEPGRVLYVSGTMGLEPDGRAGEISPGNSNWSGAISAPSLPRQT